MSTNSIISKVLIDSNKDIKNFIVALEKTNKFYCNAVCVDKTVTCITGKELKEIFKK